MTPKETTPRMAIAVLISGEGSNLQAILDACAQTAFPAEVCAVISNRAEARGLRRAMTAGVPVHTVLATQNTSREDYDAALADIIDRYSPGLMLLAGFMRILSHGFVGRYYGHLINIHPALLPKYRGLHTHRRALQAGEHEHGCSVHFVTEELDGGPVIAQAKAAIEVGDTEASLAERVLRREHTLYPLVLRWLAEGRVKLHQGQISFEGQPSAGPRVFEINEEIA